MPISTWKKGDVPDEKRKKRMLLKWSIQNDDFRKKDRIFSNCFYLSKLLLTHLWLIHSAICENRDDQLSNLTGVKIKRRTFQPSGKEGILFFFKEIGYIKRSFCFLDSLWWYNLPNYWKLKMLLRSRDLRVTYIFCVARDFQIKFRICEKFPWDRHRQSIIMLKHRG